MSYPAPPPPGGASGPNPYQAPVGSPNPYGGGVPPKKKDNTLWWILGIVGGILLLCCCGVGGFFIWGANQASEGISSYTSSANSSKNADAASATTISEGGSSNVNGAAIQSGWTVDSSDDITGLSVRNDSGSSESFFLTFYFMKDGNVIDDVTCNTTFLDAGATDYSPTCIPAIYDIQDADEIRVKDGL